MPNSAKFDAQRARAVLVDACRTVGIDDNEASLIRLGENAIYAVPSDGVVVRIARTTTDVRRVKREVAVSRWLKSAGVPVAETLDALIYDQPATVDGHPVTFWKYVPPTPPRPTTSDLGSLLRRVHALEAPSYLDLPSFDPFEDIPQRLANAPDEVPSADIMFLRERREELSISYKDLTFPLRQGPIHGDAHLGNLLRLPSRQVALIDFERFSFGPREWDLSLLAGYRYNFGWVDREAYEAFIEAYGYDVASWPGWRCLMAIRELAMTSWLMQNIHVSDETHAEFAQRVSDLRNPSADRNWKRF